MKRFWIGCALLFAVSAVAQVARTRPSSRTWIADVSIVSPERIDHIDKGSVLIEDDRIVRVVRHTGTNGPADANVVSGQGLFLVPGLIDSHVHLSLIPGMSTDQAASNPEIVDDYFRQLPRAYLYFGYTTVVDLGVAVDRERLKEFRQAPLRPDLYTCGDAVVLANGYPMNFYPAQTRFRLFPNFIYDPKRTYDLPPGSRPQDHTPAAAVASVKRSGGICAKAFFERGFGQDANLPVIDRNEFAAIREAATRSNLVLMLHANSFEAQKFGVDGGVGVLAHGMWKWGALDQRSELPAEIKALLDEIVRRRIGYQPTIQVTFAQSAYFDPDYLDMLAVGRVVPAAMLRWFNSPDGKAFKKELAGDNAPDSAMLAAFDRGPFRRERQVVAYLAAKNANFLFGTDTPAMPSYGNLPGLNGYLEMRQLRTAGLTLAQIFKAATIGNAREFKLDSQIGTIEPGKLANLVLLKRSPLETVDAYDSIVTVWVHGRAVRRDSLAATSSGRAGRKE